MAASHVPSADVLSPHPPTATHTPQSPPLATAATAATSGAEATATAQQAHAARTVGGGACERAVGERRPSRRPQSRLGRLAVLTEATEQGAPFQDAVQNTVGFLHGQVNLPETRRP